MKREAVRNRVLEILDIAPFFKEIMISSAPLEEKRGKIRRLLSDEYAVLYDAIPELPPLEWVAIRDAVRVFIAILSIRSENLAEFSFLGYMDDLLHKESLEGVEKPSPGFFAEMEHLMKGIAGETGIYPDAVPAFLKNKGRKAAKLRSNELSGIARKAQKYMTRYPCGLSKDVVQRRSRNTMRILSYFGATGLEWGDWKWHIRHVIRDPDTLRDLVTLTDEEYEAVDLAIRSDIPFGITPYYVSLMDRDPKGRKDTAIRAQVIPDLHYVEKTKELQGCADASMDFMLERDTSPVDCITRRYPMIVILKPVMTCPQICVYCQRNWEIDKVLSTEAAVSKEKLEEALQWIEDTKEISEVLITGGDLLLLADQRIEKLMFRLSRMKHVERIRLGTRIPATLPQRVTDSLVRKINRFHNPGKREVCIITHFEHPYEITPQAMEAVQKFRRSGISINNQLVYTFHNSRRFEAGFLRHKLRQIGVTPYYTFNTKGKEETDRYRVPIARLLQEQKEEARLLPGTCRTDEIVFNVPRLGKNYLRAIQHRDVISILPDGCRVYEFHPWDKKLALSNTYVYKDVSIHTYLQRLKKAGENLQDYKTIWYYY